MVSGLVTLNDISALQFDWTADNDSVLQRLLKFSLLEILFFYDSKSVVYGYME